MKNERAALIIMASRLGTCAGASGAIRNQLVVGFGEQIGRQSAKSMRHEHTATIVPRLDGWGSLKGGKISKLVAGLDRGK